VFSREKAKAAQKRCHLNEIKRITTLQFSRLQPSDACLSAGRGSATTNKEPALSVRGLIGAFSIIVAFLPGQATGQDRAGGYYSEFRGGVALLDDVEADAGSGPNADFSFETGWVAEGAVGY
jgi:hypothetical protein